MASKVNHSLPTTNARKVFGLVLGATAMLGSVAHYLKVIDPKSNESDQEKVNKFTYHNAILAIGIMFASAALTSENKIEKKTRAFLVLCSGVAFMMPSVMASTALYVREKDKPL